MSESATAAPRTRRVYFIDDSATMREVIKIAFRKESIDVVTCPGGAAALEQMDQAAPDAVISDVIMPDMDGYEICRAIKNHPQLHATPVILMSGVVNREVAEKAMAVKADELIRKPFQPQDLIARVKNLIFPKADSPAPAPSAADAAQTLNKLFGPAAPSALAARSVLAPAPVAVATAPAAPASAAGAARQSPSVAPRPSTAPSVEIQKLRAEILRLEQLVRKLQTELEAERQYCQALEAHIKTLKEVE
jgi:twitching motility two-component system response regulator PilH